MNLGPELPAVPHFGEIGFSVFIRFPAPRQLPNIVNYNDFAALVRNMGSRILHPPSEGATSWKKASAGRSLGRATVFCVKQKLQERCLARTRICFAGKKTLRERCLRRTRVSCVCRQDICCVSRQGICCVSRLDICGLPRHPLFLAPV